MIFGLIALWENYENKLMAKVKNCQTEKNKLAEYVNQDKTYPISSFNMKRSGPTRKGGPLDDFKGILGLKSGSLHMVEIPRRQLVNDSTL